MAGSSMSRLQTAKNLLHFPVGIKREMPEALPSKGCATLAPAEDQTKPTCAEFCRSLTRPFDQGMVVQVFNYLCGKVYEETWQTYEQFYLVRSAMAALKIPASKKEDCWALVELAMQYFAQKGVMKITTTQKFSQLDKSIWSVLAEYQPQLIENAADIVAIVARCVEEFSESRDTFYIDELAEALETALGDQDIRLTCGEPLADAILDFMCEKGDWA